jgi:hypothetical protein
MVMTLSTQTRRCRRTILWPSITARSRVKSSTLTCLEVRTMMSRLVDCKSLRTVATMVFDLPDPGGPCTRERIIIHAGDGLTLLIGELHLLFGPVRLIASRQWNAFERRLAEEDLLARKTKWLQGGLVLWRQSQHPLVRAHGDPFKVLLEVIEDGRGTLACDVCFWQRQNAVQNVLFSPTWKLRGVISCSRRVRIWPSSPKSQTMVAAHQPSGKCASFW